VGEGGDEVSVARFVADQRTMHQVPHVFCCRILALSVSWFYKWLGREPTDRQVRRGELDAAVKTAFDASGGTYGSPRIRADLLEDGWAVSVNTVADSMRRQGLQGRKPKHRKGLTKQDATAAKFPDLLHRDFTAPAPNIKWCGDITEIPTDEGKLYLATVLDPVLAQAAGLPHQHAPRRRTRVRRDQDRNHDARRPRHGRGRRISHRSRIDLHRNTFHGPV
jgi:putative transposase